MAEIQNTDIFLVSRANSTSTVTASTLMATIQDTDLMLVNRGDQTYKVTGLDVKESLGVQPIFPVPVDVTASPGFVSGSGTDVDPYILQTADVRPAGATGVTSEVITIAVPGGVENQPVIFTNNSTGSGNRFDQPSHITAADGTWSGRLVYFDVPPSSVDINYVGKLQIGDVHFEWTVTQGIDPVRPINPAPADVTASPDFVGGTGTVSDPYLITPETFAPAGTSGESAQVITIAEPGAGFENLVRFEDLSVGADDRFEQPESLTAADGSWTGQLQYADEPATTTDQTYQGDLKIGTTYFRWDVDQKVIDAAPPFIASVSLVEASPDSDPRFTDQDFVASVSMSDEGTPVSTKSIDAYVEGTILQTLQFDEPLESLGDGVYTETWSNYLIIEGGGTPSSPSAGFDNNNSTSSVGGMDEVVRWDISSFAFTVSKVSWNDRVNNNRVEVVYMDNSSTQYFTTGVGSFVDIVTEAKPISHIRCVPIAAGGNAFWSDIALNDSQMVDGVAYDSGATTLNFAAGTDMAALAPGDTVQQLGADMFPSTNYSALTGHTGWQSSYPAANMFDGVPTTFARSNQAGGAGNFISIGFAASIKSLVDGDVQFRFAPSGSNYTISWKLYGSLQASTDTGAYTGSDPKIFSPPAGTEFSSIELTWGSAVQAGDFYSLSVYGQELVDGQNIQSANAGTVSLITNTAVLLSSDSGGWTNGSNVAGPEKVNFPVLNSKKYLQFDSSGNVTGLLDSPQSPAYETTDLNPTLTLTFPSTFPSGNAPDVELVDGTTLTVEATATNSAGSAGPETATVQPEGTPGPDVDLGGTTTIYTGNGGNQTIVNGIDLAGEGGMVWIKSRNGVIDNFIFDTVRGPANYLETNSSIGQTNDTNSLKAFNSDGFDLGGFIGVNSSITGYDQCVSWTFSKTPGYFDVVQASIVDGVNTPISHSLGVKPGLILCKNIDTNFNWFAYHSSQGFENYCILNETAAFVNNTNIWRQSPTDTEFYYSNGNGNFIFYLFAEDSPNAVKCGSYAGTGSSGVIVDVGFKPQFVMTKCATATSPWFMFDTTRGDKPDGDNLVLMANNSDAETFGNYIDFTDTGFTVQGTFGSINALSNTYIYVAIAAPPTSRSLTQAEYDEQSLRFATYENRKEVYEGGQAQSARSALASQLIAEGYDQAAVDLMLDIN